MGRQHHQRIVIQFIGPDGIPTEQRMPLGHQRLVLTLIHGQRFQLTGIFRFKIDADDRIAPADPKRLGSLFEGGLLHIHGHVRVPGLEASHKGQQNLQINLGGIAKAHRQRRVPVQGCQPLFDALVLPQQCLGILVKAGPGGGRLDGQGCAVKKLDLQLLFQTVDELGYRSLRDIIVTGGFCVAAGLVQINEIGQLFDLQRAVSPPLLLFSSWAFGPARPPYAGRCGGCLGWPHCRP